MESYTHVVHTPDQLGRDGALIVIQLDDAAAETLRAFQELHIAGVGSLIVRHGLEIQKSMRI